jgi:hypothetical protein
LGRERLFNKWQAEKFSRRGYSSSAHRTAPQAAADAWRSFRGIDKVTDDDKARRRISLIESLRIKDLRAGIFSFLSATVLKAHGLHRSVSAKR